ncbi:SepM family pheromone-processing serine protease [Sporolactobacillus putidus]|nr:SepM family pheromone-processing serine protease [Sporolactobacillus putidus]
MGAANILQRKKRILRWVILVSVLILLALNFVRLPYYVQSPGAAQSMAGTVKVAGGHPVNGEYRLVYIYLGQADVYQYLWAKYGGNKYVTLVNENQVKIPNESDAAYNLRQENYMTSAQQSAAYVAYKAAGKKPKLIKEGVLILDVMPSMPSAKVLKPGDLIIGIENKKISSTGDLEALLKNKKLGDRLTLTISRNHQTKQVAVQIAKFPKDMIGNGKSSGIGIIQSDQIKVNVNPPVQFKIQNIGGPSAGLMMTLEIYDQLTQEDLAKGRDIAGTGTIEMNGDVGPIGGIEDKVVGANKSGAGVFLAPTADHEYEAAKQTAKEIGSHMKIVPVKTFADAVNYLKRTK